MAPDPVKVTEPGGQTVAEEADAETVGFPTATCTVDVLLPPQ